MKGFPAGKMLIYSLLLVIVFSALTGFAIAERKEKPAKLETSCKKPSGHIFWDKVPQLFTNFIS